MERCFVCGKEDNLTEGRCKECYLKESFKFEIPARIKVPYCKSCNSYYTNRWKPLLEKVSFINEILENNISSNRDLDFVSEFSKKNKKVQVKVDFAEEGNISKIKLFIRPFQDDTSFDMEASTEILLSGEQCQRCSRFYGGYYEAILQVRNDEKKIETERANNIMEIIDELSDRYISKDRMAFIARVEELKEGIDIYMGSLSAARKMANELVKRFSGSLGESHKLMGLDRDSGKKIYRTTVTVRLKNMEQRYAYYRNHLYLIDIAGDNFKLTSVEDGSILSIKSKEFEKELKKESIRIIDKDLLEIIDLSVTEVTPERYQIMRLSGDYETFYIPKNEIRSKREFKIGDSIKGVIIDNRIIIIEQKSII
ncbi:MAG: NMD3 family protein [Candidatus Methanofastidiosum methylothiophilum]|uniref:NMD3 family protein n=1 Tax=Candidatus Methanofastidiosum methylothiophilum TaxID=1705564 RepID=A0A150ISA0_9EURY|nr:MAG: NMD3 family protein [Candidatus Methanofastidiosum methylthiophilus]KYC47554.1 MAG: NMD3 family protein [Candidatus Methanofastidiosum methylthiophilus]KYC50178.1 MAG: NMD3 family protein [Candidatus Methanofastidiosum methylthiophilus]